MDHSTCWAIIIALAVSVKAVAIAYYYKDKDYKRVVEERVQNAEKRAGVLEGLLETRHEGDSA